MFNKKNINPFVIAIGYPAHGCSAFCHDCICKLSQSTSGGWDKNTIFGLVGVIVGALITYFFNKKINQDQAKGRIAIQKKNLIYAPIYKELLQLNEYLKTNSSTYYLNIIDSENYKEWLNEYWYDGERRTSGFFIIWDGIKKDIRKEYIPQKIRTNLDKITENIKNYNEERKKINLAFDELYKKCNIESEYKRAHAKKYPQSMGNVQLGLKTPDFLFKKESNYLDGLEEVTRNHTSFSEEEYSELKNKLNDFFQLLLKNIDRKNFINTYDKLVKSIVDTTKDVDKLTSYIISKYEFGKDLEKYDD